jgi:adenylate cyclase
MKLNFNTIRFKIISVLVLILLAATGLIVYTVITNYRNDMISSTKRILTSNTSMLEAVVRNLMIRGEAPLVVKTISSITAIDEYKELIIFRSDGTAAFSDYTTLEAVNQRLGEEQFERTPRVPPRKIDTPNFKKVLDTKRPLETEIFQSREMQYLFPIQFTAECRACHNPVVPVRGVVEFKVSMSAIYRQIDRILTFFPVFFVVISVLIGLVIIAFINQLVVRPLLHIGETVTEVGKGNLDISIQVKTRDEIGLLSEQINAMIRGLKERFILSRYVSRSTEDFIRGGSDMSRTTKRQLTVIFSDIRGFTSYSEKHDPEEVVVILNRLLSVQADIIEKNGGDVDNFIGDAIMGVFTDPYAAVLSGYEMIKGVTAADEKFQTGLKVGVGIACGDIISGDIGSEKRKKNTVIGDTVNLASRLASLAKPDMILISDKANEILKGKIGTELVADQKIKGKSGMINFYIVHTIRKKAEGTP